MNRILKIDPEFEKIPMKISDDEFKQLEENILKDGRIYDPIVVWNDVIVDGHNRYKIAMKHPEIPFKVYEMDFDCRESAMIWILKNQFARRNLNQKEQQKLIEKRNECKKRCAELEKNKASGVTQATNETSRASETEKMTFEKFMDYYVLIVIGINSARNGHESESSKNFDKIWKWALESLETIFEDTEHNIRHWLKNERCVYNCRKTGKKVAINISEAPESLYLFLVYCYHDRHGVESSDDLLMALLLEMSRFDSKT